MMTSQCGNNSFITHFDMSNAMAIVTNWNEIGYFSIFSIPINMMYNNYSFIFISAVMAFHFINFNSISPITVCTLIFHGIFIPIFQSAFVRAKFTPRFILRNPVRSGIKLFLAFNTIKNLSIFFRLGTTKSAAKSLRFSRRFFRNKNCIAYFTTVFNYFLSSKNSTTSISTGCIPRRMTFVYGKNFTTNWTNFINCFHEGILT